MRIALKILAVLVVGVALGMAATWASVVRGTLAGSVTDGPWRTSLYAGSNEAGLYLRAAIALHGLLALNRRETIYYTASRDSDGEELNGKCLYHIEGRDPPARWWSITAYGADDYLIPNAAGRYSISVNSVARRADGSFSIVLSKSAGGANWIAVTEAPFNVTLRLYNPGAQVAADPARVVLPRIIKAACR